MTCWKRQREPGPVQSGEHHTQFTHTMSSSPSHPWLCFLSSHFPPNLPAPWMWVSLQSCFLAVAPLPTCSSSPPPAGGGHAQWRLLGSYSQQGYHRAAWPHESWLIPPLGPAGQNRAGACRCGSIRQELEDSQSSGLGRPKAQALSSVPGKISPTVESSYSLCELTPVWAPGLNWLKGRDAHCSRKASGLIGNKLTSLSIARSCWFLARNSLRPLWESILSDILANNGQEKFSL